jgi:hypothetical protein
MPFECKGPELPPRRQQKHKAHDSVGVFVYAAFITIKSAIDL